MIGLRSLWDVSIVTNFLFNPHIFSSQWPMCNKLCALIHDALDRRRCIHEFDRRRVLLTTPIHWERTYPPRNKRFPGHFPLVHFPDTRVRRDTTRSASAALNASKPITSQKSKDSPHSITERRVPELITVLGSQPAGDVSHKPGGRLPLLSARPAVTPAILKRAATNFAAW